MRITTSAYHKITQKIGSAHSEKGGVLMGKDGVVTKFIFDKQAHTTGSTYTLNTSYLNPIISLLGEAGLDFMGIIHSHPQGYHKLSQPDCDYFLSQIVKTDMEFFYTPIVFSARDGAEYDIFPYKFYKDSTIELSTLEVVPDNYESFFAKPSVEKEDSSSNKIIQHQNYLFLIRVILYSWTLFFTTLILIVLFILLSFQNTN